MNELIKEIESFGFECTNVIKCEHWITRTFQMGVNGEAEVINVDEYKNGSVMIRTWHYKDSTYTNMPLNLICGFSTYYEYIHLEEMLK